MNKIINTQEGVVESYYSKISVLITSAKQRVVRNINYEMVNLYYEIGATINELIDKYGLIASQNEIIRSFSLKLTNEFG